MNKKVICLLASSGALFDLTMMRKTNIFGSFMARRLLTHMDHWIAISEQVHQDILAEGVDETRISRIPNGVDVPSHCRTAATVGRFLYLGRLSRTAQRDVPTMLQAFDDLLEQCPDCELRLVGGGDLEDETRKLLDTFPRARIRTEMVGFCDPRQWLEWADILVQPSIAEGMSNTLLEAMSYGIACIANDIPPNREVLDNGRVGILVPVGDRTALVSAMTRLTTAPEDREQIGRFGRQRVEQVYSMEHIANVYLRMYEDIAKVGK
jgi:glycosyltransferase involved in cell wall biosynthesis